jgi:hypothetical protein
MIGIVGSITDKKGVNYWDIKKVRAMGFEPTTVGFGVQRSTVGATPSPVTYFPTIHLSTQFHSFLLFLSS